MMGIIQNRLFAAINQMETDILDQFEKDISTALTAGYLDTKQYSIKKLNDSSVEIQDKISNTNFNVAVNGSEIMVGSDPRFKSGDLVSFVDSDGKEVFGNIVSLENGVARVKINNRIRKMCPTKLSLRKSVDRSFSKSRARMYLVDESGKLMAFGWLSSLMSLKLAHPNWKIISSYDWNATKLPDNLKYFSKSVQKEFTRQNRRYVIIDNTGTPITILDVTTAKGYVANHPGTTMIREFEYNKSKQPKIDF